MSAVTFKIRPADGVRYDDPDGVYIYRPPAPRIDVQLIVIGAVPASPGEIAKAFSVFDGREWKISSLGYLAPAADPIPRQATLDRGFYDFRLLPA